MSMQLPFIEAARALVPFYFGIDVGGTTIKIGLVDDEGRVIDIGAKNNAGERVACRVIPTETSPQVAVQKMQDLMCEIITSYNLAGKIRGIGFGIPSVLDVKTRRLVQLPNLHSWVGCAICDELQQAMGIPVTFSNDANAAAYGEYWVGSGAEAASVALLTLGTGIGTGIILDGKLVEGSTGRGGECGHIVIDCSENASLCGCGQRGHVEAYAGAMGLARRTLRAIDTRNSSLRMRINPNTQLSQIPRFVCEEAENGDAVALEMIQETAYYLSLGIVSILNTVDPECILIGGAMTFGGSESCIGKQFLEWLRHNVFTHCFPAIVPTLRIEFASLGGEAGFIGAAGISRAAGI